MQISLRGTLILNSDKIASAFKDYFLSSIKELATNFSTPSPFSPVLSLTSDQFSFSEISQNEVTKTLHLLKNTPVCDIYGLNFFFLKTHAGSLVPLFQHLINIWDVFYSKQSTMLALLLFTEQICDFLHKGHITGAILLTQWAIKSCLTNFTDLNCLHLIIYENEIIEIVKSFQSKRSTDWNDIDI